MPTTVTYDAGAVIEEIRLGATRSWTNAANAVGSDDAWATSASSTIDKTHWLKWTTFGASIPDGSQITSIVALIEWSHAGMTYEIMDAVQPVVADTIEGSDASGDEQTTSSDAEVDIGLTGFFTTDPITPAIVNASDFGFAMSARSNGTGMVTSVRVDH